MDENSPAPQPGAPENLRALSVQQPFAELILSGRKHVEYRTRPCRLRERVYIYASKAPGPAAAYSEAGYSRDDLVRGKLLGTVEIVDCTGTPGNYRWRLARPLRLPEPLATTAKGQPSFFWPFGPVSS